MTTKTPKPLPADMGAAILDSVRRMNRGEYTPRVHKPVEGAAEISALRAKLGISQAEFAARFGLSVDSLRHWEQGRRQPEGAARTLLAIIAADPVAVAKLVREAGLAA